MKLARNRITDEVVPATAHTAASPDYVPFDFPFASLPKEWPWQWNAATGAVVYCAPVPPQISAWQAKAALALTPHPSGGTLLDAVAAVIAAMPEGDEKTLVRAAWDHNASFSRQSPTIVGFATALGLDAEQVNELFRKGARLTV